MRSAVKTLACLLFAMLLAGPSLVLADGQGTNDDAEAQDAEAGRFAIAFAFTSGVLIQQQDGFIDPSAEIISLPPPGTPPITVVEPPVPFRSPSSGSFNAVSPNVGANLEIMFPAIEFVPLKPRFFVTGEILPTFAPETTVALEGSATEFLFPIGAPTISFPSASIGGVGSRLRAEVMTTVLAANAGIAFEFDAKGNRFRLKPSVGWIRWGVIATGRVLAGYKDDGVTVPQPPIFGANVRLVTAEGRGSGFFHALGPGLEFEMDLQKRGRIRPTLYMSGFAYRTLTDDTIQFSSSQVIGPDELGETRYNATWTFKVAPWSYRAAIGIRFRWVGK